MTDHRHRRPMPRRGDPRTLAADLFNHTWTLLETPDRTPAQDDEMIHSAHASRYHWGEVADASRSTSPAASGSARGSTRSSAGPSRPSGTPRRCLAINEAAGSATGTSPRRTRRWPAPHLVAGDAAEVAAWKARATGPLDGIADQDDRELIEGDLATLP